MFNVGKGIGSPFRLKGLTVELFSVIICLASCFKRRRTFEEEKKVAKARQGVQFANFKARGWVNVASAIFFTVMLYGLKKCFHGVCTHSKTFRRNLSNSNDNDLGST